MLVIHATGFAQPPRLKNAAWLKALYRDTSYITQKARISKAFAGVPPGHWGEFVKGVDEDLVTSKKIIALTMDACGGPHGDGYDAELINYLRREKIPATLFVTGKWIDANYSTFLELSRDTLFEIENHGLMHQPCSVDGESEYGIRGTPDVPDAFDEIEANARKIKAITGRRPLFYRSATAYTDEACAKIARTLNITTVSFDVLSGDAVPFTPVEVIKRNILSAVKPGALIILHFNRPLWYSYESLREVIPQLRKEGYRFARLESFPLKGK